MDAGRAACAAAGVVASPGWPARVVFWDLSTQVASAGELPEVRGNAALLHQLFQNLVGNALKYRKPDVAPQILIRGEVDTRQGQCCISVVDNGVGFDQSRADWIFEPFQRLVTAREFEGSGVGMATAKKIVDLHGGAIRASSEEGHGATFVVTLPMPSKPVRAEQIKLLIVDDEPGDLALTVRQLASAGFEIVTAESAKQALAIVESGIADVVLSDYQMPIEDGLWLLGRLAEQHPSVRRLLTSSISPRSLEANTQSGVVQGFWPKTVTAEQLRAFLGTDSVA